MVDSASRPGRNDQILLLLMRWPCFGFSHEWGRNRVHLDLCCIHGNVRIGLIAVLSESGRGFRNFSSMSSKVFVEASRIVYSGD